jgi:hypothetical protein
MWIDLLILAYILLLFPLMYECEMMPHSGYKVLFIGVLFTPVVGFLALNYLKKKWQQKELQKLNEA